MTPQGAQRQQLFPFRECQLINASSCLMSCPWPHTPGSPLRFGQDAFFP